MSTSKEVLSKEDVLKQNGVINLDNLDVAESVLESMDEYAKQQSIAFAEWCEKNDWMFEYSTKNVWNKVHDVTITSTTEQLYTLFLQSLNK